MTGRRNREASLVDVEEEKEEEEGKEVFRRGKLTALALHQWIIWSYRHTAVIIKTQLCWSFHYIYVCVCFFFPKLIQVMMHVSFS